MKYPTTKGHWELGFELRGVWCGQWGWERERKRERSGGSFGPEEKVLPKAKSYYIYQFCFWDKDKKNGVFLWD